MKEDGREQESERYVHLLSKAERQREQDVDVEAKIVCEAQYRRESCCFTRVESHPQHSLLVSPSRQ